MLSNIKHIMPHLINFDDTFPSAIIKKYNKLELGYHKPHKTQSSSMTEQQAPPQNPMNAFMGVLQNKIAAANKIPNKAKHKEEDNVDDH